MAVRTYKVCPVEVFTTEVSIIIARRAKHLALHGGRHAEGSPGDMRTREAEGLGEGERGDEEEELHIEEVGQGYRQSGPSRRREEKEATPSATTDHPPDCDHRPPLA